MRANVHAINLPKVGTPFSFMGFGEAVTDTPINSPAFNTPPYNSEVTGGYNPQVTSIYNPPTDVPQYSVGPLVTGDISSPAIDVNLGAIPIWGWAAIVAVAYMFFTNPGRRR